MIANQIIRGGEVPIACPKECFRRPAHLDADPRGVMVRVDLSRLEEGLGHAGYRCSRCGHTIKRIPA